MKILKYRDAFLNLQGGEHGRFHLKDGSTIEGEIINFVSDVDDPNGISCIDVATGEHSGKSVYSNQFDWAEIEE